MEIILGDIDPYTDYDYLIPRMREWVAKIDNELRYTRDYETLFKTRFVTFEEYQDIWKRIPEDRRRYHKAFVYFDLMYTHEVDGFKFNNENDEVSYARLVLAHSTAEMDAFLRNLRRAIMPYKDLCMHAFIRGASGSGKSTFINAKIYQIQRDYKVSQVLIDPAGDLPLNVKRSNLNYRNRKVIYFDYKFRKGYTPVFNPFRLKDLSEDNVTFTTQELSFALEMVMQDKMSINMTAVLKPCIHTLILKGDSSIAELQRFMDDSRNSDLVKLGLQSPVPSHRTFFARFKEKGVGTHINTTKNSIFVKLQDLLNDQDFYNVTTGESTFDLEEAVNADNGLVIFNLGGLGKQARPAFGGLVVASLAAIYEKRKYTEEQRRQHTFNWIDECGQFVSPSLGSSYRELRKYGGHYILCTQYASELKGIEEAVMKNSQVKIIGQVNEVDTSDYVKKLDLPKLEKYEFYCKIGTNKPFVFKSNADFVHDPSYLMTCEQEREFDEEQIRRFYRLIDEEKLPPPPAPIVEREEPSEDDL